MTREQAAEAAQKIAQRLFTAPDGKPVNRLRQDNDPARRDGRKMLLMDWAYVVNQVRDVLEVSC
jgi:hypothetical protein